MDGFIIKYNNQKDLHFHNFVQFGKNGSWLCYRPSAHFVPFKNRMRPPFFYLTDNKMRPMSNFLNHFDHSQNIFFFIYWTKWTTFHFVCVYLISQTKCDFSEHSLQFNWKMVVNESSWCLRTYINHMFITFLIHWLMEWKKKLPKAKSQ